MKKSTLKIAHYEINNKYLLLFKVRTKKVSDQKDLGPFLTLLTEGHSTSTVQGLQT